jgi:Protein of unknown function (DUF2867)
MNAEEIKFFTLPVGKGKDRRPQIINRTVHAAALSALAKTQRGYRFYFAIYVRKRGWTTPVYMAAVDPFRRWVIYPAILRQVESDWTEAFGTDALLR